MTITTVSSREFNQNASLAKKAALDGPVFITDRGQTAHVLLSFHDYQKIIGKQESIADLLAMQEAAQIDFEAPRMGDDLLKPVEL